MIGHIVSSYTPFPSGYVSGIKDRFRFNHYVCLMSLGLIFADDLRLTKKDWPLLDQWFLSPFLFSFIYKPLGCLGNIIVVKLQGSIAFLEGEKTWKAIEHFSDIILFKKFLDMHFFYTFIFNIEFMEVKFTDFVNFWILTFS